MDTWQNSVENRLVSFDDRLESLGKKLDRNFYITWAGIIGLGLLVFQLYIRLAERQAEILDKLASG